MLSAAIFQNTTIKVPGDGDCAFHAFGAGLRLKVKDLDDKKIADVQGFLKFLAAQNIKKPNGQPYSWPEFKDYLTQTDSRTLQRELSPALRKFAIKLIRENPTQNDQNKEFTLASLQAYFQRYIMAKINNDDFKTFEHDDILDVREFNHIQNKFDEIYNAKFKNFAGKKGDDLKPVENLLADSNKGLKVWWEKDGHPKFLEHMEQNGKWAGHLEVTPLANFFGANLKANDYDILEINKKLPTIELLHEVKHARNKHWNVQAPVRLADVVLFNLLKISGKEFDSSTVYEPLDFENFLKKNNKYDEIHKILITKNKAELDTINNIVDKESAIKALQALVSTPSPVTPKPLDKKIPATPTPPSSPLPAATTPTLTAATPPPAPTFPLPATPGPTVAAPPSPGPSVTTIPTKPPVITTPPPSPVVGPATPTSPVIDPKQQPTSTPVVPPAPTTPPPPKTPPVVMSPEEKKLRQASIQTTRAVLKTLIKTGTVDDKQARTAIASTKQSPETKAATLRAVDLPKEANQFRLPKGVDLADTAAAPKPALTSSLEKCYTLKSGETKTFEISEGAAKGVKYKSEYKNNILTTKVDSFTTDIEKKHSITLSDTLSVPSEEVFAVVDKLLFDQVLNGAGRSAKHKVHIQIEPKDEFHQKLIDAFVMLCEAHGLVYQNDTANLYQPFNGGPLPPAATAHVADLIKGPHMNQHERYDAAAANAQIAQKLADLKAEAKGKPGNFEQKIDEIQKMFEDGIKNGRVDSSNITKLLDDLSNGLTPEELKEIDTTHSHHRP